MINEFIFGYRITIENHSSYTVQLLSRFWNITDAFGHSKQVEGLGVVGQQPILEAHQGFEYTSACHLGTEYGTMSGKLTFSSLYNDELFEVDIPRFTLFLPARLN